MGAERIGEIRRPAKLAHGMARRTAVLLASASGFVLAAFACTPFACAPFATAPEPPEAGTDADATARLPPSDGGDPALDGGAHPDAATGACPAATYLCESFDGDRGWPGWKRETAAGSSLGADETRFVSPPVSMLVTANAGAGVHPTCLRRDLPAANHVLVRAKVSVEVSSPPPDSELDVVSLELDPPAGFDRYFVALIATANGQWHLERDITKKSGGTDNADVLLGAIAPGFDAVLLDLDLASGTLRAEVGGASARVDVEKATGTGHELAIGAAWIDNRVGSYAIRIDDVSVEQ